ncbi:MAG: hypothetical protein WB615_03715 [Candidatus Tumulicola sp.]
MDEYLIGAGAVLTAGPHSSIAGATLHAQTDPLLAANVRAAVIDFEAPHSSELSRVLIVAPGWATPRFASAVVQPLLALGECTLAGVMGLLARATGTREVHLFARWAPDAAMSAELNAAGIRLVTHPLESIEQAALVSGQRFSRWRSPFRAA